MRALLRLWILFGWALMIACLVTPSRAQVPIYTRGPSSSTSSVPSTAFPLLGPDGTTGAPSYSFSSTPGAGLWVGGVQFGSGGTTDIFFVRDLANTAALKNGASSQTLRIYGTTTGPKYVGLSHDGTNGVLAPNSGSLVYNVPTGAIHAIAINGATIAAVGATGLSLATAASANQLRFTQTTAPTITVNGGTGPACVGTDTAMACTIGTAPPAAATFTITFNGTWAAAPSCVVVRGTTGTTPTVAGVVSGTTTLVVNLSANLVASERYNVICNGVA